MPKLTLSFKGRLIDVYHLKPGETLIGRNPSCDICIDSLAIAPLHAKIVLDDQQCRIEVLDEEYPLSLNYNSIERSELTHGDLMEIGKHTLAYAEDAIEPSGDINIPVGSNEQAESGPEGTNIDESRRKGILQILSGTHLGRIIPLNRNLTRIGRAGTDCAMISLRNDGYYISYLEGPNPPQVNDHPIGSESFLLKEGDMIEVGETKMQFHF
ncbi:FHA domain-containing protein [Candidatus Endoriftia persephone]|jgi:hypothetical protein|uniref:FHA domain containing protein n=3 Tax=Gammaproteobacteria TaxID=1236 RepID=G2FCF6_9GAMM|nr:FHA domain-containing protein [Candidatus Endoriftia persephone]EGV50525.1 FHA domain containing protein [endosymbiont of Riftia pachyptila (vent Ph05)]EGW55519.1 FHA domain containing protein [endosymbiont of Tevnia jerichonana (vent Tica)]USF86669.1 FHA domain-containing protein [Candidatus Endoriftia persephone]